MRRALAASGLSSRAFAARYGVAYHRVSYWRSKQPADGANSRGFAEARVVPAPAVVEAASIVELELSNGRRLLFRGGWAESDVQRWLRAVEGL